MADFLKSPKNEEGGASWMITFADLLSLLLTFFVMVFSMNAIQFEQWEPIVQTMNREFNPKRAKVAETPNDTPDLQREQQEQGFKLSYVEGLIRQAIENEPVLSTIQMNTLSDRFIISLPATLLFEDKAAERSESADLVAQAIIKPLVRLGNRIIVEGHSDRREITTTKFRSNWELSLTRARKLAGLLTEEGYRMPIGVTAYADTRLQQLDDELTLQQKYDLSERIDIIVVTDKQAKGVYDIF
jgi:chemotaxis protein MotB